MTFKSIFLLLTVLSLASNVLLLGVESKPDSGEGDRTCKDKPKGGEEVSFELFERMKIAFIWVPEGKATLGSPKTEVDRRDDEPEHEFTTAGFWLAKYECTQAEWLEVMETTPSNFSETGEGRNIVKRKDTSRFPVEQVMWNDCQEFLKKINERGEFVKAFGKKGKFVLPHEDQWEYACRGGKGNATPFYWGAALNGSEANCNGTMPYGTKVEGEFLRRTASVGSYNKAAPHPWSLCDMTGSVWEWCDNWYDNKRTSKVLRGGAWIANSNVCRTAYRTYAPPDTTLRSHAYGFRLCVLLD